MKTRKQRTPRKSRQLDMRLVRDMIMLMPIAGLLLVHITGMTWVEAVWLSPVVVAGVFIGLFITVQLLHMAFRLIDHLTDRFQLRRSPLA